MLNKSAIMYIHLLIAFLVIFLVKDFSGPILTSAISLYLIYLVSRCNSYYLPAIVVICSAASNSLAAYFTVIVLTIIYYKLLKEYKVNLYALILLGCLPIIMFISYIRYAILGFKLGLALTDYGQYFGLFPFLYGIIIHRTIDEKVLRTLIIALFIVLGLEYTTHVHSILIFYCIPLVFSLLVYSLQRGELLYSFRKKRLPILIFSTLCFSLYIIHNEENTLTQIFSSLYATLLTMLYYGNKNTALARLSGFSSFILVFLIMVLGISIYKTERFSNDNTRNSNLISRVQYKLFEDRGPIWDATYNWIAENKTVLPQIEVKNIIVISKSGLKSEVAYGGHNTFLEFIRIFGIILGLAFIGIYIIFTLLGRKFLLIPNISSLLILFIITSTSCMIFGGLAGGFPVITSFSMLNMTMLGVGWAAYSNLLEGRYND